MKKLKQYFVFTIFAVGLSMIISPAHGGRISGKTSTQTLPPHSDPQTAPLPSNTRAVTLPSTSMEYQKIEKPLATKLEDTPDFDIAGELRDMELLYSKKSTFISRRFKGLRFRVALMNRGKLNTVTKNVPFRIQVINTLTNTLIKQENYLQENLEIRNNYWVLTSKMEILFLLNVNAAPEKLNDVKLVVDIDPANVFGEAHEHRGNNTCIATW